MRKPNRTNIQAAFTLIEITAVIAVLLGLIAVLFIGISGWIAGTNRAQCILNQRNVQTAVRSYANMYELNIGDALDSTLIMVGDDKMMPAAPVCKAGGTYTYTGTVPATSVEYGTCSDATHVPKSTDGW